MFDVECGPRPLPDGSVEDPNADIYEDCPGNAPPPPDGTTASPPDTTTTEENNDTTTTDDGGTTEDKTTTTVTTTSTPTTTTVDTTKPPPTEHPRFPEKIVGFYITLADDFEEGFETEAEWDPVLYEYQQTGANVLFFTFVNPATMEIPK